MTIASQASLNFAKELLYKPLPLNNLNAIEMVLKNKTMKPKIKERKSHKNVNLGKMLIENE